MKRDRLLFTSQNCPSCKQLKKKLEDLGVDYEKKKVESKEGSKLATELGVTSLPTFFINGDRITGDVTKQTLKKKLN